MKILVTGPSGSGKSYLTKKFNDMGFASFDSDLIPELGSWYFRNKKIETPKAIDKNFMDNHAFLWDEKVLKNFLGNKNEVIVFGMSGNVFDCVSCFDKVYFLKVPHSIIAERLQYKSRSNPMGETEEQRVEVLKWAEILEEKANDLNIEFIDGTLPAYEIKDKIYS